MSIGWICNSNYYDGVHRVKHKLTGEESFVYVGETLIDDVYDLYAIFDCKTNKVVNNDDYDHLNHYEDGKYFECSDHEGVWLFDDGDEFFDECPKCKSVEDEISSFKVAEDVYQYTSNKEFNRLKHLLKAEKYIRCEGYDVKPKQGLFILITEYDSEWGETYYYYKTIERDFMESLNWKEKT